MSKTSSLKPIFLSSLVSCLIVFIAIIGLLIYLPTPEMLSFLGFENVLVLADASKLQPQKALDLAGQKGLLMDVRELWGLQTSFYETVITILVFINGLVAAAAAFYIRGSSHEKAEETAEGYLKSELFDAKIKKNVDQEVGTLVGYAKKELDGMFAQIDDYSSYSAEIAEIRADNEELRRQIGVISKHIAAADQSDQEGSSYSLNKD